MQAGPHLLPFPKQAQYFLRQRFFLHLHPPSGSLGRYWKASGRRDRTEARAADLAPPGPDSAGVLPQFLHSHLPGLQVEPDWKQSQ